MFGLWAAVVTVSGEERFVTILPPVVQCPLFCCSTNSAPPVAVLLSAAFALEFTMIGGKDHIYWQHTCQHFSTQ